MGHKAIVTAPNCRLLSFCQPDRVQYPKDVWLLRVLEKARDLRLFASEQTVKVRVANDRLVVVDGGRG